MPQKAEKTLKSSKKSENQPYYCFEKTARKTTKDLRAAKKKKKKHLKTHRLGKMERTGILLKCRLRPTWLNRQRGAFVEARPLCGYAPPSAVKP